ncbi:PhoPQ-regulated protein, partial [Salmonella enterica subsp. enterica serovar Infantis]|nr:PhoPQ-regulated protein [Salmonella enterica subsp. enterica serovar Infantis]
TARNPAARDFRYACDIKYNSVPVSLATGDNTLSISLTTPDSGWQATYIEATFTDGYVATTQVYITPDEKYPETAPPSIDASCQTLPGRGLSPTPVKQ